MAIVIHFLYLVILYILFYKIECIIIKNEVIIAMRKIYTTDLASVSGPYSHAVDAGDFVYVSGQTARNANGEGKFAESITDQTHECFNLLFDILKEANLTPDDVVKVNVFLNSMEHFNEMNEVYQERFSAPYPARTCVAVLELPLGADVEIEVVAKKFK